MRKSGIGYRRNTPALKFATDPFQKSRSSRIIDFVTQVSFACSIFSYQKSSMNLFATFLICKKASILPCGELDSIHTEQCGLECPKFDSSLPNQLPLDICEGMSEAIKAGLSAFASIDSHARF